MDAGDFTTDAPGELVDTVVDGQQVPAFVPDDLSADVVDDGRFVTEVGQAMRATGKLDVVGPMAGSNRMLVEAFARKEAVQSSRIEGTEVTLSDMYRYEARQSAGETTRDDDGARQATNYLAALDFGLRAIENGDPITTDLLCDMHGTLLEGVRSGDPDPGAVRDSQNYIAPFEGAPIARATFVPPPPDEAREKLATLLDFANGSQSIHPLVKIGLVHYQFETLHPFRDGNGRLGRLLISLELQREELLGRPYLYFSAYFNEHRPDYIRLLDDVRQRGEWETWIHFFLRGIWTQAQEAQERASRLTDLRRAYTDRYQDHRSPYIVPLTHRLFENPYITATEAQRALECSHQTAYNLIETLREDGVLVEAEDSGEHTLFYAEEIYDVLDDPVEGA